MSGMQPSQWRYLSMILTVSRFKNFEAGRLTSLSEVQRQNPAVQELTSEYGSETDLSKTEHDEKSVGGTTMAEISDDFDLNEHGKPIEISLDLRNNTPQSTPTRSTTKSPVSSTQCVAASHQPSPPPNSQP